MKYKILAEDVLRNVGGKDNVDSVAHCITRLRFQIKDDSKVNLEKLKNLDGVLKVMISGGQHQVVIGNHVPKVFKEVNDIMCGFLSSKEIDTLEFTKKKKILDKFIDIISGVFTPVLGVLSAAGMIKGLCAILIAFKLTSTDSGTYGILNATGDAIFYFLPLFLGYTSAKKFNSNIFIGMSIGASLLYPALEKLKATEPLYTILKGTIIESPITATFMSIPVILSNYSSTVIPIIFAVYFSSKLEKAISKIIPDVVKTFLVPFFTLLIAVPLTFIMIGPLTIWASKGLGFFTLGLINLNPIIAGIFIGGFWQVLVIFGLHWGLIPIAINNMMTLHYDTLLVTTVGSTFAQIGVVLAIYLKTKDKKLKSIALPAFISGIFGVTEAAIYGVTLPRKKPFIISCIVSAITGGLIGIFGSKLYTLGGIGIFLYPSFINPQTGFDKGFWGVIICTAFAFILGFILMYLLGGFRDEERITD